MKKSLLIEAAKSLVEITIKKHKEKLLGRENMSIFIKKNLKEKLTEENYNKILHLYNRYLASKGYEIKKDITKFDVINYNSEEYELYINKNNI